MNLRHKIFAEIETERTRQIAKHPEGHSHCIFLMLAIIGEEKGECDRAALDYLQAIQAGRGTAAKNHSIEFRKELVQLAATAVKALELYDTKRIAIYADQVSPEPAPSDDPAPQPPAITRQAPTTQPINPS